MKQRKTSNLDQTLGAKTYVNNSDSEKPACRHIGAKGSGKTHAELRKEPLSNIDYLKAERKLVAHVTSTESKLEKLTNDGFTRHDQEGVQLLAL